MGGGFGGLESFERVGDWLRALVPNDERRFSDRWSAAVPVILRVSSLSRPLRWGSEAQRGRGRDRERGVCRRSTGSDTDRGTGAGSASALAALTLTGDASLETADELTGELGGVQRPREVKQVDEVVVTVVVVAVVKAAVVVVVLLQVFLVLERCWSCSWSWTDADEAASLVSIFRPEGRWGCKQNSGNWSASSTLPGCSSSNRPVAPVVLAVTCVLTPLISTLLLHKLVLITVLPVGVGAIFLGVFSGPVALWRRL